jgi:hypothetical protein
MKAKPALHNPSKAGFAEMMQDAKIKRYTRQQSAGGRVAALEQLHARLFENAQLYESDDLQDQRDSVADSLLAVVDFLKAQGFAAATLSNLMRPVAALAERENNSLDLMFAQRARPGRPKATLADSERTGILAALAEGWLQTCKGDDRPQSDKLAEAARKMKGKWFGSVTRAQLETARELVSQEAGNHPAVEHFRLFSSFFDKTVADFGIESAFSIMVQWLNSTIAPFGFGQRGILKTPPVSPTEDS